MEIPMTPQLSLRSFSIRITLAWICMITFLGISLAAQDATPSDTVKTEKEHTKWDVAAEHGPTYDISFHTDEGTWMTVDVSPDGKQIVFDLLGDIYIMPIEGDTAQQLTSGPAYDVQPRFNPDGKKISFTSDRDGIDNIWVMGLDSMDLNQISKEKERQLNNAVWTPDGNAIIARKHYRNTRSLGAGEMWLYHVGGGSGLQLTKRKNWQQDAGEPALSMHKLWDVLWIQKSFFCVSSSSHSNVRPGMVRISKDRSED